MDPEMIKLLEKHGFLKQLNGISIPVIEEQRDLQIESLWNQGLSLMLTYSLNVLPSDQKPDEIPYFKFDRLKVTAEGEEPLEIPIMSTDQQSMYNWPNEGVVLDNRIYRRVWIHPEWDENIMKKMSGWMDEKESGEAYDFMDQAVLKINKVAFEEAELVVKGEEQDRSIAVDDIALDYQMQSWDPLLDTIQMDKTVQLGGGESITYKNYEIHLHQQRLYFDMESESEYSKLTYKVNGMTNQSRILEDEDGNRYITIHYYPGIQKEKLSFSLLDGSYPTNKELKFSITEDQLNAFRNGLEQKENVYEINQDLGTINGIAFKLLRLEKTDQGPSHLNYGYALEIDSGEDFGLNMRFRNYGNFLKHRGEMVDYEHTIETEPFFEITDQTGEQIYSDYGFSQGKGRFFGLEVDQFEHVKELNVRYFNLPMKVKFQENEIELPTS
jgi:hypothetical protein